MNTRVIFLAALSLLVFSIMPPPACAVDEETINQLANTLVTQPPDSKEFKDAAAQLKGLTTADQAKVAQAIVSVILKDADKAVGWLMALHTVEATAGRTPYHLILGPIFEAFWKNLVDVLQDPTTSGGKNLLIKQLLALEFDNDTAIKIVAAVEQRVFDERERARQEKNQGDRRGNPSLLMRSTVDYHFRTISSLQLSFPD